MCCKRFLACLLAVLLAFSLVPVGRAEAEGNWETAYKDFVLGEGFRNSGLSFHSDAYVQTRFSLYDLDGDGVPELLAFNGGPSMAVSTVYVFRAAPPGVAYVGNIGFRGCALYELEGDPVPRLYCTDGNNGVIRTVCYEMHGGTITREEWELDPDGGAALPLLLHARGNPRHGLGRLCARHGGHAGHTRGWGRCGDARLSAVCRQHLPLELLGAACL